ncbi:MAG: YiiX/YebB-like N1pC/P60 family cysteine hydrolase [Rhizobiaceae bacterium]
MEAALRRILAILAMLIIALPPAFAGQKRSVDGPAEIWPKGLIAALDPLAAPLGVMVSEITWREGYLPRHPDAFARVLRTLKPMDVLVLRSRQRLTSRLIPGWFIHTATYLGTERELKALGVWDHPDVKPHWKAIRAGKRFIEADHMGVRLSEAAYVLATDAVAVVRPTRKKPGPRTMALSYFGRLGTKYDFHMNAEDDRKLFCSELTDMAIGGGLPRRRMYDRVTIVPSDVAVAATNGTAGLSLVLYMRARRDGWEVAGARALRADVKAGWAQR